MYQTKVTKAKEESVQAIRDKCPQGTDIILTNYSGLNVNQMSQIRKNLSSIGSHFHVVKNNYAKIAFNDLGYPDMDEGLKGPTALAYTTEDSAALAKELFNYAKESSLKIKSGLIEGVMYDSQQVEAYSALPSRLQLISQLMATATAPVQYFASGLNAITSKLVRTLQAIVDSKTTT